MFEFDKHYLCQRFVKVCILAIGAESGLVAEMIVWEMVDGTEHKWCKARENAPKLNKKLKC